MNLPAIFLLFAFLIMMTAFLWTGIHLLRKGLRELQNAEDSRTWARTEGSLDAFSIVEDHDQDGVSFDAHASYSYTADGQNYTGTRILFGNASRLTRNGAKRRFPYQPGSTISVYYDPLNPSEAVLIPGRQRESYGQLLAGAGFFLGGLMVPLVVLLL